MTDKSDKPKAPTQTKHVPKDAQVIMCIMKDMGISEYEPRVINQLLEFTYRYVTCALDDARVFANHAKKKVIDMDDVRLAVQMQLDKSFSTPLPRETLLEIARAKNVTPLPLIKPHCGLRLPPDRYCLSSCNYMLKVNKKPAMKTILGPGQGATSKPTGKPTIPQTVMVKRPGLMTVAKTQPSNVPKPVFKFSSGNKVIAKPAIKVTSSASPQQRPVIKKEVLADNEASLKRKREDDDYDVL